MLAYIFGNEIFENWIKSDAELLKIKMYVRTPFRGTASFLDKKIKIDLFKLENPMF